MGHERLSHRFGLSKSNNKRAAPFGTAWLMPV